MKKRILCIALTIAMIACMLLSSCAMRPTDAETATEESTVTSAEASATPESTATPEPTATATPEPTPEPKLYNPLSGEEVDVDYSTTRPVAIMVEQNSGQFDIGNYTLIQQGGISKAEIVIEMQVEQCTRNMAIFMNIQDAGDIYPIRSARSYFASLAVAFDCIYGHCGYSEDGLEYAYSVISPYMIENGDNSDIAISESTCGYRMTEWPHISPHDMCANGADIWNMIEEQGARTTHESYDYGLVFTQEDATPEKGETANNVLVTFPGTKTTNFTYDESKKAYSAYMYDADYLDDVTGEKAMFENVLVLAAPTQVGIDDHWHTAITTTNLTEESGWFIHGGKAIQIKWSRGDYTDPIRLYNLDGSDLELGVGHTYICFTSSSYCADPTLS